MMGNGWGAGMGWMWVLWPVVIIATVAVVALLVRSGADRSRPPAPVDQPPAHEADEPTAAAGQPAAPLGARPGMSPMPVMHAPMGALAGSGYREGASEGKRFKLGDPSDRAGHAG